MDEKSALNLLPQVDWEDLLLTYMHDPFDKALDIQGHERRAARYASAALGREATRDEIHHLAVLADQRAAVAERLPSPSTGSDGERAVGPADGLMLLHPMSGVRHEIVKPALDMNVGTATISEISDGLDDMRQRFLAIWRLLPDRLALAGPDLDRLPADTRLPDHTLTQHADINAGLHAALAGAHGAAYLSFAIGPVQPFIAAARSVRDLWSGSAILSWLTFQAMRPILERLGPTAFVYPSLRGNPLVDLWLIRECGLAEKISLPSKALRLAPSLPNRFVALVPWGANGDEAEALHQACVQSARDAWARLADTVRLSLEPKLAPFASDWSESWDRQVNTALDFRATVVPERPLSDAFMAELYGADSFSEGWPDAAHVRGLATAIPASHRPGYSQDSAGRWQAQMETSARLMAAARSVRHFPASSPAVNGLSAGKCTLFGSWEQMGPTLFADAGEFWSRAPEAATLHGVRIRPGERLSAVAMTKRFAAPALLARELELETTDLRFPDTATVAAAEWLKQAEINPEIERDRYDWSGQWLHWHQLDQDPNERPVPQDLWARIKAARKTYGAVPAYYAVIALDGDEMGRWLAGEKTPLLRNLMHPKLRRYFESLDGEHVRAGLCAKRPVGPALHAAISAALAAFAAEIAPEIVAAHNGLTIYSGGDDVLALCPVSEALRCARALRLAFSGLDDPVGDGWRDCGGLRRITMGPNASMSAGVLLAHLREDLRLVLTEARDAESRAKSAGRDLLDLTAMRRSGEMARAICPWEFVPWLDELRITFKAGASNRWTYRLRAELPTLASDLLPLEAMQAEIRRLVDRSALKAPTGAARLTGAEIAEGFADYCALRGRGAVTFAQLLEDFTLLCQSAAFMSRGRDD